jgi:CBS domain-containing protein
MPSGASEDGGLALKIAQLLKNKGDFVATVSPDATVREAVAELARHKVGALVVSADQRVPVGIISERDVVRRLHAPGPEMLDGPVSAIMSTEVRSTSPDDEVESLMVLMTRHRIRHVPVLVDGQLAGIVSIGDVVKSRLDELQDDNRALIDYIQAR